MVRIQQKLLSRKRKMVMVVAESAEIARAIKRRLRSRRQV